MSVRAWVSIAALLAACGPSTGGDGSGTSSATDATAGTDPVGATEAIDTSMGPTSADSTGATDDAVQQHIEAYCEAWLSVECAWPRYDSVQECVEHYGQRLSPYANGTNGRVYAFDEECAALRVETLVEGPSCENGGAACSIFYGSDVEGTPCEIQPWISATDCAAGLSCTWSTGGPTCQPSCATLGEGEACGSLPCGEGLWCVVSGLFDDGTCTAIPGVGDPCLTEHQSPCPFELWCDDGICSDQYGGVGASCADGEPCDLDTSYCNEGTCEALLPLSSPCTRWWQCESTACVSDVCSPLPDAVGMPCHQEKRCAEGLECDSQTFTCREPFVSPVCNFHSWCPNVGYSDGTCQEGDGPDQCVPDSDPVDCGYCPKGRQGDGQCDEGLFCAEGTDPDC